MEYIELRQLVNKCLMGDIQISKQILLTSSDRTETTMVSFLNHLMKYNKIKKENLFTFYFKLIDIFNRLFSELMTKSKSFDAYVQHVKKEWNQDENILYDNNTQLDKATQTVEDILENMNTLCGQFRELNDRVNMNNMNDVLVEDEMVDHMDEFLERVRELKDDISDIENILNKLTTDIERLNMGVLLDLSMKGKTMYLQFSDVDDDTKIPDNINITFLNYVYLLNLIKKHILYYKRTLDKINEISNNMGKYVDDSKDTIKSKDNLFHLNKQQSDIDKYLDGLESEIDMQSERGDIDGDLEMVEE
jgi:polyhydroxyalkanoate synthesis regulator phasin